MLHGRGRSGWGRKAVLHPAAEAAQRPHQHECGGAEFYVEYQRIQVFGETEVTFLAQLGDERRREILETYFGFPRTEAERLMMLVHNEGRAVVANGPRETCELHVFRLHEHGLWATMQRQS